MFPLIFDSIATKYFKCLSIIERARVKNMLYGCGSLDGVHTPRLVQVLAKQGDSSFHPTRVK
jgi:hypothetical protein